jgi:predicted nucleic acid-binding protein
VIAMPGEFLDTNILVYAFSDDAKAGVAEALLARGCVTSVQGLNEFANVARRRLAMSWSEIGDALASIRTLCRVIAPLDIDTHLDGVRLAERYGLSPFDALMLASALRLGCETFWSEDMQNGMIVEERMTILDPFRSDIAGLG